MSQRLFAYLLASIVAIVAVAELNHERDLRAFDQQTTIPGNLAVGGTTTTTGETIALSGVRLTTASTGPTVKSGTGSPSGSVSAPQGSLFVRTDSALLYQNTDGATAWSQVNGSSSAGSVSFTVSTANLTNVNLSTEGTVDWVAYGEGTFTTNTGFPYSSGGNNTHRKITGGRLAENFRFVFGGGGNLANTGSTAVSSDATKFPGRSTTGSDSLANSSLSSSQNCASFANITANGNGAVWRIPMRGGETGTIKIYGLVQDHTETYTLYMESNSAGVVTNSTAGSAGNPGTPVTLTITYTAATGGDFFVMKWSASAIGGFNPRLYICSGTMF